ncbi:MAG: hypothetical protein GC136_04040 [Alphaproteobacteria bacterium]|nr:hypothetical protein [Alphaproteobacteria bacterium]
MREHLKTLCALHELAFRIACEDLQAGLLTPETEEKALNILNALQVDLHSMPWDNTDENQEEQLKKIQETNLFSRLVVILSYTEDGFKLLEHWFQARGLIKRYREGSTAPAPFLQRALIPEMTAVFDKELETFKNALDDKAPYVGYLREFPPLPPPPPPVPAKLKYDFDVAVHPCADGYVQRENWKLFYEALDEVCKEDLDREGARALREFGPSAPPSLEWLLEKSGSADTAARTRLMKAFADKLPDVYEALVESRLGNITDFSGYEYKHAISFFHRYCERHPNTLIFNHTPEGLQHFLSMPLFHEVLHPCTGIRTGHEPETGPAILPSALLNITVGDALYKPELHGDPLVGNRLLRIIRRDCYPVLVNALYEQDEDGCIGWETELWTLERDIDTDVARMTLGTWGGGESPYFSDIQRHIAKYFNQPEIPRHQPQTPTP